MAICPCRKPSRLEDRFRLSCEPAGFSVHESCNWILTESSKQLITSTKCLLAPSLREARRTSFRHLLLKYPAHWITRNNFPTRQESSESLKVNGKAEEGDSVNLVLKPAVVWTNSSVRAKSMKNSLKQGQTKRLLLLKLRH
jgi:hypothetical protein